MTVEKDPANRKCTVIGSGPSGVHFALAALELGYQVEMIDVGVPPTDPVNPKDSFYGLKQNLDDPAGYFLGDRYEGVFLPGMQEEFYGIPPSKAYALETVSQFDFEGRNFNPMFSFATGGLAQMWTAGSYPFTQAELAPFHIDPDQMLACYSDVAREIGINGEADDLSAFIPLHEGLQQPLKLDRHSEKLLQGYQKNREFFQSRYGCFMGRARQAVISEDLSGRKPCQYLGRCLWGCPIEALYTPSITLKKCIEHEHFTYHDGLYVTHFNYDDNDQINTVETEHTDGTLGPSFSIDRLILACGTLGTSRIFMESVYKKTGQLIRLNGLMDNRQMLAPFLNLGMIGQQYSEQAYQYNQLAIELGMESELETIHCLVTTLKASMIHPIVEKLPFDLRTSLRLFRHLHAALGVLNINFHDNRRDTNYLSLQPGQQSTSKLEICYQPPGDEQQRLSATLKRLKKIMRKLGCIIPSGMVHVRPMGASVHYAGTLPITTQPQRWSVDTDCKSYDFDNLYIADGASYPYLPAKNITYTLMANARRIGKNMARRDGRLG